MIQRYSFEEKDFKGERFKEFGMDLAGCNDILCLTQPESIIEIHKKYIQSGADIISTNTFNANSISLSDYGLHIFPGLIRELNREAVRIAKRSIEESKRKEDILIAGSIGPTNRSASLSPSVENPTERNITFQQLYEAYKEQIEGLIEGNVDILLFETVFDTLNLKAGLNAANDVMQSQGMDLPIMVSATISGKSGRTLSGQTLAAFATSTEEIENVVSVGLNCSFGPSELVGYVEELGKLTSKFLSCHPNAGLPDDLGCYDVDEKIFAEELSVIFEKSLVNIIGGCCGTTPGHISLIKEKFGNSLPYKPKPIPVALYLSGLDRLKVHPEKTFLKIGERCNVMGSRKFLRLISEKNYSEASEIALKQVEAGADVIDINMDAPLLDSEKEMKEFIRYISSEPEIAKVPVMIDSSNWEVVETALENLQGKSIVNSISLKEGEESFLARASHIKKHGCAVVIMAFDEKGQADTFERRIEICERAYNLLTKKLDFNPNDIIFDVNVMAVATGIKDHNDYAQDFIRAVEWVKRNLKGVSTSGGISNLSFAFRGKNHIREAMHSVFLHHARNAGLDMAILNPDALLDYESLDAILKELIEDIILNRREDATDRLLDYMASHEEKEIKKEKKIIEKEALPVNERLVNDILTGNSVSIIENLKEASLQWNPMELIEGPLMEGMKQVGKLFGEGRMFLPQVVKSARAMKAGVDYLKPAMEELKKDKQGNSMGKVLFATVKGDVHDIGKNIASIVLACNNFEIIDLGVMVPTEDIVRAVKTENPDLICLSGLITPSLAEMVNVAKRLEKEGIDTPLMVGGATTSLLHTALKISPNYSGTVIHVDDASQNPVKAAEILNPATKQVYSEKLKKEYSSIISAYEKDKIPLADFKTINESGENRKQQSQEFETFIPKTELGKSKIINFELKDIEPFINWKMFFHAWKISGEFLEGFPFDLCDGCVAKWKASLNGNSEKAFEALKLYKDARQILKEEIEKKNFDGKGSVSFHKAYSKGNDIFIEGKRLPLLRQQRENSGFKSLSDYIKSDGDFIGFFAVTAGKYLETKIEEFKVKNDSYNYLLYQSLADRLAEASSEWLHYLVRTKLWGYSSEEILSPSEILKGNFPGIRPAWGYPMLPDQTLVLEWKDKLPHEELGIEFTLNGAMKPSASVAGLYISHPESSYFMIGKIGDDQMKDYAERRGLPIERIREILAY